MNRFSEMSVISEQRRQDALAEAASWRMARLSADPVRGGLARLRGTITTLLGKSGTQDGTQIRSSRTRTLPFASLRRLLAGKRALGT